MFFVVVVFTKENLINIKWGEKRWETGEGVTAYSCYNESNNRNLFPGLNVNYKWIKSVMCHFETNRTS